MQEILVRVISFVAIIALGYVLRRIGVFKKEDFSVLSKIVLKITLPAAVVSSFAGKTIEPSLLLLVLLGFGGGVIYILFGIYANRRTEKESQIFDVINLSGYNIGCFTMPFAQGLLGPVGVIAISIFDVGNAFICLGGSYGVATSVKAGKAFDVKRVLKALGSSVAFLTYLTMIILSLLHVSLPGPVISFAQIVGNANPFAAMLMIGIGFELSAEKEQIGKVFKVLAIRYGVAAVLGFASYFLLPFELEVRQALFILFFSPMAAANPAYTGEIGGDVGMSSAVNSMTTVISIVAIVTIMLVVL